MDETVLGTVIGILLGFLAGGVTVSFFSSRNSTRQTQKVNRGDNNKLTGGDSL